MVLTQERLFGNLAGYAGEIFCVDRDSRLLEGQGEINPQSTVGPDNLAYVVYTSGSTGKPKGVLSRQQGAVNYLSYLAGTYDLSRDDIVLQLASLSFDASVRDIMGPLAAGARLVVIEERIAQDPEAILWRVRQERVSCVLSVVPTLLGALLDAVGKEEMPYDSVRLILVAGEALALSLCRRAKEAFGQRVSIVNQYGPTECTMTSSYHPIEADQGDEGLALIGRPIPNARIYIFDGHFNPVPVGVYGEVHIAGVGVTRGYLNEPELTAERYLPNRYGSEVGERLYRTGDMSRYLCDGRIEFRGRVDHQVKLHGVRIELGEIEAALSRHADIKEAVVVAREETSGEKRLVAYVVSGSEPAPSTSALREFLKETLPEYMMPSAFVFLDALPLTSNGKVDRKALPEPDQSNLELEESYVAPRTPVEEVLTEIWAQVLRVEQVGIHDNFFELGGHSLRAIQVIARVRKGFQVELPVRQLFETPTVAGLAEKVEAACRNGQALRIPPLESMSTAVATQEERWEEGKL